MHPIFKALVRHSATRPEAVAFEDDHRQITWGELAQRVETLAGQLDESTGAIGIGLAGGIDYVVADLATSLSGKRQVPLPFFFSNAQNAHILMDAGITTVITNSPEIFAPLPQLNLIAPEAPVQATKLRDYPGGAERVIYTSGSSGTPKGVIIGEAQLDASILALSGVIAADPTYTHLSILPLAQLLEQICGVFLPIVAGAKTVFRFEATKTLFGAPITALTEAFDEVRPTTSLLAPAILRQWTADLKARGAKAPDSLRFVAVGGAASSPALINAARDAGIPAYEGYGLSECCAVVAINRLGENKPGTVGPVLEGLTVEIDAGEIIISGPTVMTGYLNADPAPEVWRTGDMGHFEGDCLVIDGRKDALLVTGAGRNISPEWVEQRVNADPRIIGSALGLRDSDGALVLIVAAAGPVALSEITALLGDLPDYARPSAVIMADPSEPELFFPVGTPNRKTATQIINTRAAKTLAAPTERPEQ